MGKLRVGILGAGSIAATMADTLFRMWDAECVAIASRDIKKAQEFALAHGIPAAYGSYEDMMAADDIDLVYVATPHSHHFEHGMLCLQNGKNVLMEKSFTSNEKEAKELIRYATKHGLFLGEAIWVRYMPMVRTIKKLLESGIIGEPGF